MPRQSSISVKYADLIHLAESTLREMEGRYAGARARGTGNLEALTHQVETAKMLVRMLRKGLREKQTDFLELFEQVRK